MFYSHGVSKETINGRFGLMHVWLYFVRVNRFDSQYGTYYLVLKTLRLASGVRFKTV